MAAIQDGVLRELLLIQIDVVSDDSIGENVNVGMEYTVR